MRKNKFLALLLLAGWVGMTTSCSNESVLTADGDDMDVAAALGAKLVFSIATPSAGNIVMRDTQTDDETAIKSVNVYLFALSESVTDASTAADSDYTLLSTTTFTSDGDENAFTNDGSGTVECAIDIDDEWSEKTIRALIVANDTPTETFTVGTSTIADLTGALASATVSNGDHADVLVGNPADDSATGFPMAAEATYTDGTETTSYVTLGSETVELSASLVRTVARVDIRNSYDGLTVDYVYISGVANQSYLFAQSSQAAPSDASYIKLYPMTTYCDSDDDSIYTSWSFTSSEEETTTDGTASSDTDSSSTESDETADEYEAHEGEFYLYEQESSATNCPTVYITFSTSAGYGTVDVPFQSSNSYVNVERNHRYIIVLGGEEEETGTVTASLFDASDWDTEDDDVITVSVTKTTTSSSESE